MNLNNNYIQKKIFLVHKESLNEPTEGRNNLHQVNLLQIGQDTFYYINVFLTKTCEITEYVDVKKDEKIFKINRQEINPFYINFGFFNSIRRIKVNNKYDLTPAMISYLETNYQLSIITYLSKNTEGDFFSWFDDIGYNLLINDVVVTINETTGERKEENGLEKLEKLQPKLDSLISKSFYFPISINK
jgi:hypothetical protein